MSVNGITFELGVQGFEDSEASRAQRVNEAIGGEALAVWLAGQLKARGLEASPPWVEDHGWDFSIVDKEQKYLCVCTIEDAEPAERHAFVTLSLHRSLKDTLLGRNRFAPGDAVAAAVGDVLTSEPRLKLVDTE